MLVPQLRVGQRYGKRSAPPHAAQRHTRELRPAPATVGQCTAAGPCWHRPPVPLILAAAQPPPLITGTAAQRDGDRAAACRRLPMLSIARFGGVPTPPNLRPISRAGSAASRVPQAAPGVPFRVPVRVDVRGFGVAGSSRFGRAWGSPPAMDSGQAASAGRSRSRGATDVPRRARARLSHACPDRSGTAGGAADV